MGFTLAEVLITLGIIGVVAAMTMPNLVANYQKKVWVIQLKKDVSFIQNAYKNILAIEGVDRLADTPICYSKYNYYAPRYYPDKLNEYWHLEYANEKTKFYKFVVDYGYEKDAIFTLNDGSCIAINDALTNISPWDIDTGETAYYKNIIPVIIDVNCDKGPNKSGRDRFEFYIDENLKIVNTFVQSPLCSQGDGYAKLAEALGMENNEDFKNLLNSELGDAIGLSCFYRIMRDGWEMNY